jgi:hypothetical protein
MRGNTMQHLDREFATAFDHNLIVSGQSDSYRGQTLVTVNVDAAPLTLMPTEARALAALLTRAANMAEGV